MQKKGQSKIDNLYQYYNDAVQMNFYFCKK